MLKIISGGQSGIDRMALELAKEMRFETGGYAPKNYMTEFGSCKELKDFGLIETESSSYMYRTKCNIKLANGSILFGNPESTGGKLLIRYSKAHFHSFIINPVSDEIENYIKDLKEISVDGNVILNIAGNRASKISEEDLNNYKKTLYLGLKPFKYEQ